MVRAFRASGQLCKRQSVNQWQFEVFLIIISRFDLVLSYVFDCALKYYKNGINLHVKINWTVIHFMFTSFSTRNLSQIMSERKFFD